MAQLPQAFDANQVPPNTPLEAIPAGKYLMQVRHSELKPTKSGNGQYLQLENEVLDGQFKGRIVFERLNIVNPNQTAVEIAYRTLSSISRAVGVMNVTDSAQLHNRPFIGDVKLKPAEGQYDARNEMRDYEPAGNVTPAPAAAPTAAQSYAEASAGSAQPPPPAAASAPAAPPWAR